MGCPKECNSRLSDHHKSLYDKDGVVRILTNKIDGAIGCIGKKISWKSFGIIMITVVSLITWYADHISADRTSKGIDIANNTKEIAVTVEKVTAVEANIRDIKTTQAEILNRQFTLDELRQVIKEAVKE